MPLKKQECGVYKLMTNVIIKEHSIFSDFLEDKEITVIDLGSCMGEFINEINSLFKIKKAILVEPNRKNFELLPRNDNFILLNKAAYSKNGEYLSFTRDIDSPYNGSLIFDNFNNSEKYHIETVSLASLIDLMDEKYDIDLLKIDIEGAEYDLLLNSSDSELLKFKQITVEFHDFLDSKYKEKNKLIEKRMIDLGFDVLKNGTVYMLGSDYYDTLFTKK